jgi:putative restriction endonuclease
VGQGGWRTDLLRYWRGQCAITGLTVEALLRASHIKPWRDSDNAERLDVFNGLLLGAAYDAAFDAGLIAFDDDGRIVISTSVADEQREAAGLDAGATLRAITDRHRSYLAYHRLAVFEKARTL